MCQQSQYYAGNDNLSQQGSTNGQAGIELTYNMAEQASIKGRGVNRVILVSNGDFLINHQNTLGLPLVLWFLPVY
jgi:hypothetical protein